MSRQDIKTQTGSQSAVDTVVMPKKLTAENGAKFAFIDEFEIKVTMTCIYCKGNGCGECDRRGIVIENVSVPWHTIKKIYEKAVDVFGT